MMGVNHTESALAAEDSVLNRIRRWFREADGIALLITCAITLPFSATSAFIPGHLDEAIFIYIGEMWTHGVVPYLQLFDNKPPGIFAITAIASGTHHTLWALAVIQFCFVVGCVWCVRKTLQTMRAPSQTVFLGTIGLALIINLRFYSGGTLPEVYMLAPMAASMWLFVSYLKSGKLHDVFLAGMFSGLACIFKPFAVSVFMAQCVFLGFLRPARIRNPLGAIFANTAGAIAAWIPAFLYFALHGALKQMLDASFFYNVHYGAASQHKLLDLLTMLAASLLPLSTMVGCIAIGLARLLKRSHLEPEQRELWQLTVLWFGFGLALVMMAGRGYNHYFLSLDPSLDLAGALVFWPIEETGIAEGLQLAICSLILAPVFITEIPGLVDLAHDYTDVLSHRHKAQPIDAAAAELARIASPSSTVFVWGFQPYVFYATHLHSAFRFPTSQYIYDSPSAYVEVGNEVLTGMRTSPPDFVVMTPQEFSMAWPHQSDPVQDEFRQILRKSYTKVWEGYSDEIYRRNN